MPIVTIQVTREGTKPGTNSVTSEEKAAAVKGASQLLLDVLNKPLESTFVVIGESPTATTGAGAACPRSNTGAGAPRRQRRHPGRHRPNGADMTETNARGRGQPAPRRPQAAFSTWRFAVAGLCASLVGIGLARFAYTPLIPALISAKWFSASDVIYLGAANLTALSPAPAGAVDRGAYRRDLVAARHDGAGHPHRFCLFRAGVFSLVLRLALPRGPLGRCHHGAGRLGGAAAYLRRPGVASSAA